MVERLSVPIVLAIAIPASGPNTSAAPNPKEKAPSEKALKEFVAKVVAALGKQDIDRLDELSDVPFYLQPGKLARNHNRLRDGLKKGLDGKLMFEGEHEVKRIRTFKEAKAGLGDTALNDYKLVLADDDFLVHVAIKTPARPMQARLFIKIIEGKPRLVGLGEEE